MKAKIIPKARVLTTDGELIEIYDEANANALYFDCMSSRRQKQFLKIEISDGTRFIPTERVKDVFVYDVEGSECQDQD